MNYAAGVVFEVRQPAGSSEPVIRFNFKNGSDDTTFIAHNMSFPGWDGPTQGGDAPLSKFLAAFEPVAVNTTLQWCQVCNQTSARGCGALLSAASTAPVHHDAVSPVGAGFIGAGVTIVFMSALVGLALAFGLLAVGKRLRSAIHSRQGSDVRFQAQ